MKHTTGKRSGLSESLHRQLNAYALAASAAGVGMVASVQPAEAKIVYTPAHTVLIGVTNLDLNHDKINDFAFTFFSYHNSNTSFGGFRVGRARGAPGNQVRGIQTNRGGSESYASALRAGALIGPKGAFAHESRYAIMVDEVYHSINHTSTFRGPWANGGKGVKNRYLGLKFFIKGKVHFGWARVTITLGKFNVSGLLTGYAYETIAGKAIIAGAIKGPDDDAQPAPAKDTSPTPEPATLGMLALGAPGLSIWRRDEPVAATSDRN